MKRHASNLTLLAMALACAAGPIRGQDLPLCKHTHTIMHFTPEWVKAHHERRAGLPVIHSHRPGGTVGVNLSTNMNFASCGGPTGWDQGACGNCWVFGSTAAASVDDGVASGTPKLFSTQWFDSDYYATDSQSTCDGGDDTTFADWYNGHPKFIPWSNTGAGYADGNGPSTPATPASSISQSPYVGIGKISVAQIATSSVSQAEAIANIKSVLDNHQAVLLAFFLPSAGWTDFDNAWDSQSETTPWAGVDTYNGSTMDSGGGGHLVCVVGYDETDSAWIIQNSWGTTNGRPDGWFELPQAMNYADTINYGGNMDIWEFDTFVPTGWSNPSTGAPTITTQPANQTVTVGATATFSVTAAGTAPLSYQWYQSSAAISGATSASYTTPPTTLADSGATFHVVVTNTAGSATSNSATLTVTSSVVTNLVVNGGFESGTTAWKASSGVVGQWGSAAPPYAGTWDAWLCGPSAPAHSTSTLSQTVAIPATITQATLAFYLHINGTAYAWNGGTFKVRLLNPSGSVLATLASYTSAQAASGYQAHSFDLSSYKGQTVVISFTGTPGRLRQRKQSKTSFVLDNVSLDCK
jgi:hypothetical protein